MTLDELCRDIWDTAEVASHDVLSVKVSEVCRREKAGEPYTDFAESHRLLEDAVAIMRERADDTRDYAEVLKYVVLAERELPDNKQFTAWATPADFLAEIAVRLGQTRGAMGKAATIARGRHETWASLGLDDDGDAVSN